MFASLADFFEELDLDLLDLEQTIVLLAQKVIDFFVKMPDFQFGFEIHFVIVFRSQPVTRLGPVLTHHDDRRLERGETGENEIQKNERVRIEAAIEEQECVESDPGH